MFMMLCIKHTCKNKKLVLLWCIYIYLSCFTLYLFALSSCWDSITSCTIILFLCFPLDKPKACGRGITLLGVPLLSLFEISLLLELEYHALSNFPPFDCSLFPTLLFAIFFYTSCFFLFIAVRRYVLFDYFITISFIIYFSLLFYFVLSSLFSVNASCGCVRALSSILGAQSFDCHKLVWIELLCLWSE